MDTVARHGLRYSVQGIRSGHVSGIGGVLQHIYGKINNTKVSREAILSTSMKKVGNTWAAGTQPPSPGH